VQGERTLLTDPHDGKSLGIRAPDSRPDIILVSHDHFDHNCTRVVRGDFTVVREAGEREVRGIQILGMEVAHDESGGSKRGKVIMFRFRMNGISFLHCGDLGQSLGAEQLGILGKIDVLFVPVGGVFTLDGRQARKLVHELAPRVAIPMHYRYGGLALSIQNADAFLEGLPSESLLRVGNEIEFTKEELPQGTEFWVFSP